MVEPQPLSDPRVLRAIAHPVRTRVLDELQASGPARAADIARELGIPANQASFHLRQLAKYGLVEEAPEEARDKRDRVWRADAAAHQLREEIDDLVDSWADRTRGRDPERRTYLLVQMVQPYPDEPTDPTDPTE